MSEKKKPSSTGSGTPTPGTVDTKLEVVVIPVSDVDQAKAFYESLGWRLDADRVDGEFRVIQFTPTGSSCSVQFGANLTAAEPGSTRALLLIVSDIDAAHDDLVARGVKASDVFHCATGSVYRFRDASADDRASGPAPDHNSYGSFVSFSDPDGNGWVLQEVTSRLPGRTDPAVTSFGSTPDLASALRRAAAAHGEHEKRIGESDANWPDWYADYMVREQSGAELPQ
jgi:catechol 2,3-dioxygenase-like lactoylglutathione lyase family enzyme